MIGVDAATLAKASRIDLADSALHARAAVRFKPCARLGPKRVHVPRPRTRAVVAVPWSRHGSAFTRAFEDLVVQAVGSDRGASRRVRISGRLHELQA